MAKYLQGVPDHVVWEFCILRAKNVSIERSWRLLKEQFGEEVAKTRSQGMFPTLRTFERYAKSQECKEMSEKAREEVLRAARRQGFALHGIRVNALDEQIQKLDDRIAAAVEAGDDKLLVELAREKRLTLAEMRQQMAPFEQAEARASSPAERFAQTGKVIPIERKRSQAPN